MGKYEIRADVARNRLYVVAEGFLTEEENKASADQTIEEMNKLKPGFDIISDTSTMKAATQEGIKEWDRLYQALADKGYRRSIGVIQDNITRMQVQRKSAEAGFKQEYAASVEEAELMLNVSG